MYKLHYFPFPGRAEVCRLCFTFGGIPYEDVFYTQQTFPEAKPKFPFGQLPVLELPDGKLLAQSGAIDRYAAKLTGLYPEDPLEAARADEALFLLAEFIDLFMASYHLPLEEKIKARQDMLAGKGKEKLTFMNRLLEARAGGYVAGDKLSYADLAIFAQLSGFISGFFEGIPVTLLDDFPALKAFRNKIANEPRVKAFYEKNADAPRLSYKPDA